MARPISEISGIGETYQRALADVGITSVEGLLDAGKTKKNRQELSKTAKVSEKLILSWVNRADLFRIKGIAGQYSDLLEVAGVDTVKELAQRNAGNLHAKMAEVNAERNLTRKLPTANQVTDWVAQAKELPRGVEY